MWLFPCCGEEAVGYSLYHRQSAWGGDALQNLCLLTRASCRFRAPQCCLRFAVGGSGRGALAQIYTYVLTSPEGEKSNRSYGGVELDIRRRAEAWFVSMSFRSLKEFGVSAERLGSICKRWMARVQRSVCDIAFTVVFFWQSSPFTILFKDILVVCQTSSVPQTTPIVLYVAVLDHLWDYNGYWEGYFVLNLIPSPQHRRPTWLQSYSWFPAPVRKCLCPWSLSLYEWANSVVLVDTPGIDFLSPRLTSKENGTI